MPHPAISGSADYAAGIGAAGIALRLMADLDAWPDIAGVLEETGAAIGPGRPRDRGGGRRRAGTPGENRDQPDQT